LKLRLLQKENRFSMSAIQPCPLPEVALLRSYAQRGAYTDCFVTEVSAVIAHAAFVEAFYTTPLFKLERLILSWVLSRPSTDLGARALARGESEMFAAWSVEGRAPNQFLLCDMHGRTRSWLMVAAAPDGDSTRFYFGSAVVPVADSRTGQPMKGFAFRALLGFHQLYSRLLLAAAVRRLG
jgi:hypothetical protein